MERTQFKVLISKGECTPLLKGSELLYGEKERDSVEGVLLLMEEVSLHSALPRAIAFESFFI